MKAAIYIETSIISYLASYPSRDLITAAHQQITHEWWRNRRNIFDLFISQLVIDEISTGDSVASVKRLSFVFKLQLLDITPKVTKLAELIFNYLKLPHKAGADAMHIALAINHRVDYLMTWNCTHIANAEFKPLIEEICKKQELASPIICTPEELMGEVINE